MGELKSVSTKEIFKWGLLSISLYINFLGIMGVFFRLIIMLLSIAKLTPEGLIITEILFHMLRLGILILALTVFYNKFKIQTNIQYPRILAIASFIALPVLQIIQVAVYMGSAVVMTRMLMPAEYGRYTMFTNAANSISLGLTLMALMIFGLIVSSRSR